MRRRALLAAAVLLLVAAPAASWRLLDFGAGPTRWDEETTVLYLNEKNFPVGSDVGTAIRNAIDTWNRVEKLAFWFSRADNSSLSYWSDFYTEDQYDDGFNDVMAVAGYLDLDTWAVSVMRWNEENGSNAFFDVDVLFNANLNWSTTGAGDRGDLQSVALHQFGHVLGLADEPSVPGAVMNPIYEPGLVRRQLTADDVEGARNLYPWTLVEPVEPPPGTIPGPLVVTDLAVSGEQAAAGERVAVTGRVRNASDDPAAVNSLLLTPSAVARNLALELAPGEEQPFEFDATVTAPPGAWPVRARVVGYRDGTYFASEYATAGTVFRVHRGIVGYTMQDSLAAELGPSGEDEIRIPLLRGTRIWIELRRGAYAWPGERELQLRDPDGVLVRSVRGEGTVALRPFRAKRDGDHLLTVRNLGESAGEYVLVSDGKPRRKRFRTKAVFEAGVGEVEVELPALPARAEVDLELRTKKKKRGGQAPAITGYRTPSGFRIDLEEPLPSIETLPLTETGSYRILLALPDGPAERRIRTKVKGRVRMADGVANRL